MLDVAEILGDGQPRQCDSQASARGLGHLAVDQRDLALLEVLYVDHARLLHLEPEVVPLAGALAHAGEHRVAAVLQRDVVDQLHDEHGLADARTAEEAGLAPLHVGLEEVDDLDPGLEHFDLRRLIFERGRVAVDRPALLDFDVPQLVHGLADDVDHAAQRGLADGHRDRLAGILRAHPAHHAVGRLHGDRAHAVLAEVLLDFANDIDSVRALAV